MTCFPRNSTLLIFSTAESTVDAQRSMQRVSEGQRAGSCCLWSPCQQSVELLLVQFGDQLLGDDGADCSAEVYEQHSNIRVLRVQVCEGSGDPITGCSLSYILQDCDPCKCMQVQQSSAAQSHWTWSRASGFICRREKKLKFELFGWFC